MLLAGSCSQRRSSRQHSLHSTLAYSACMSCILQCLRELLQMHRAGADRAPDWCITAACMVRLTPSCTGGCSLRLPCMWAGWATWTSHAGRVHKHDWQWRPLAHSLQHTHCVELPRQHSTLLTPAAKGWHKKPLADCCAVSPVMPAAIFFAEPLLLITGLTSFAGLDTRSGSHGNSKKQDQARLILMPADLVAPQQTPVFAWYCSRPK